MIKPKIISGGQTGVDQGALDFAIDYDFEHGGYCPKGRKCEAGVIPFKYHLTELESEEYADRTRKNVLESDATIIIHDDIPLKEGSLDTIKFCNQFNKPFLFINTDTKAEDNKKFKSWIKENNVKILNIAGNRSNDNPGIKSKTYLALIKLFGI